jgi:RNA polymerase sigma factor (sigma-70 family)
MIATAKTSRPTKGLPKKETHELAARARQGDKTAIETLLAENDGFIKFGIWRALGSKKSTPIDHYIGAASIGFIQSILGFKESFGVKLTTYAYKAIIHEVWRQRRQDAHLIHIPDTATWNPNAPGNAGAAMRPFFPVDASSECKRIPCEPEQPSNTGLRERIESLIGTLNHREAEVLRLYFGIGVGYSEHSLAEISHIFRISHARACQIKDKAIRKLQSPGRASRLEHFLD